MTTEEKRIQYARVKDWRLRHPDYHRNWQRRKRGSGLYHGFIAKGTHAGRVFILGVFVRPDLMEWLCRPLPNCY